MREFKQIEEKTTHSFRVGRVDREHGGGQEAGSGAEHQPGDGRVVEQEDDQAVEGRGRWKTNFETSRYQVREFQRTFY